MVVALLLLVAIGFYWWFVMRDRGPVVEGEIDEPLLTEPTRLCVRGGRRPCRSVDSVEQVLSAPILTIEQAEATSGGMQGAISLAVEDGQGTRLRTKWRSHQSASIVNTPVKELAAYGLQALFLEPEDQVIPPVVGACFEVEHYRAEVDPAADALEGTDCVYGFLAYWLVGSATIYAAREDGLLPRPEDIRDPQLYSAERFRDADPATRRNLAILNLVTHLVNNGDAHAGQFVLYEEPLRLFVIDNSIAFQSIANPVMTQIQDLSELMVPSIPADVADRLRGLQRADLDALASLEELARVGGAFEHVEPGEPIDPDERIRVTGDRIQAGLTTADLDDLWDRFEGVQERLASGALGTF
ncbi:MAG: hypothetical protein CMN30_09045 [Sandaracinus sp.]|nr:hypothetical protein [Sandaracinus sp.]